MAKYKDYNYSQTVMIPLSLEEQLVPGTLEYAIHHIIEHRINLDFFNERFKNDNTGRHAINPKVLLKIILLAYSRGIISSRPIEKACCENITFMALACRQTPDHSTIAAFVSSMEKEINQVFSQVLMVCAEEELLGGTHFSLDGLKLPSNASKEWSGTHSDLKKKQAKIEKKVKDLLKEHRTLDKKKGKELDKEKKQFKKKIDNLNKKAKRIEEFLLANSPKTGARKTEIQSNVSDNESAKMATSHGVIQGYNANAMVDERHQIVVQAEAFGNGSDGKLIQPMIEGAKENFEAIGLGKEYLNNKIVSADTGYFTLENLETCREENLDAYIPDPQFRKRDPRFTDVSRHRRPTNKISLNRKKHWFTVEDFTIDEKTQKLVCPAGKSLYKSGTNMVVKKGYIASKYKAPITECRKCKLRKKCIRKESTPQRQVLIIHGSKKGSVLEEMKQKIDTVGGRKTYSKRMGIVEPVFGNIRIQKRMDRFTLCGKIKVRIQWLLYCVVHNIEKVAHFGRSYALEAV